MAFILQSLLVIIELCQYETKTSFMEVDYMYKGNFLIDRIIVLFNSLID